MIVPKPIRKFAALFRGDVAPTIIVLSVALGFWFGLTPGWYGIHAVLLVLVLVLNVHLGLFLVWAAPLDVQIETLRRLTTPPLQAE